MNSYNEFGSSSAEVYGTDANFQANYQLTPSFLDAHKTPFLSSNRIWIGGYDVFQADITDYDALLTSEGIQHTTETPTGDGAWLGQRLGADRTQRPESGQRGAAQQPPEASVVPSQVRGGRPR